MTERRAVIVDVVRTPFGKGRASGVLAGNHPADLLAGVIEEFALANSFTNAFPPAYDHRIAMPRSMHQ